MRDHHFELIAIAVRYVCGFVFRNVYIALHGDEQNIRAVHLINDLLEKYHTVNGGLSLKSCHSYACMSMRIEIV